MTFRFLLLSSFLCQFISTVFLRISVKLPEVSYDEDTKSPSVYLDKKTRVDVKTSPVSTSFAVFDE